MEEVRAVVDEAHQRGKPVVAHAHRPEEIRRGLRPASTASSTRGWRPRRSIPTTSSR